MAGLAIIHPLRRIGFFRKIGVVCLGWQQHLDLIRESSREAGGWNLLRAEFGARVPVLMYHRVGSLDKNYRSLTVSTRSFNSQIKMLLRLGYTPIKSSDLLAWYRTGKRLPKRPVLLTFDDGYAELADHVFPLLTQLNIPATVFIVTRRRANLWDLKKGAPKLELLTAEQIHYWAAEGIEFAPHSRTHRDLTTCRRDRLVGEVAGSREDLRVLGSRAEAFAYPYGAKNNEVEDVVREHFALAFGVEEGMNDLAQDINTLRRTMVQSRDSALEVALRLRFGANPLQVLRSSIGHVFRTACRLLSRFLLFRRPGVKTGGQNELLSLHHD
jgi:peptidoglycan/xylan/chitin deacetylase (PgdA/CDA1 family)